MNVLEEYTAYIYGVGVSKVSKVAGHIEVGGKERNYGWEGIKVFGSLLD
jgi:hypothetical protein